MGNYRLISKSIGQDFAQYNKNAIRLNFRTPKTVDEVVVGLKDNPSLQRKITTFRDEKGQIMERAFDYHDKPYRNRLYSHLYNEQGAIAKWFLVCSKDTNRMVGVFCFLKNYEFVAILW